MSLKSRILAIGPAFGEAFICLALALQQPAPGILLRSSGLCLLTLVFWSWVFYAHIEIILKVAGLLSFFVVSGAAMLGLIPSLTGGPATISGMAGIAPAVALMLVYSAFLALAMVGVLFVAATVISIRLALRWVLMGSLRERPQALPGPGRAQPGGQRPVARRSLPPGPLAHRPGPAAVPGDTGDKRRAADHPAGLPQRALSGARRAVGLASGAEQMQAVRRQRGR